MSQRGRGWAFVVAASAALGASVFVACAAGETGPSGDTGGQGGVAWSTSSTSGSGGAGASGASSSSGTSSSSSASVTGAAQSSSAAMSASAASSVAASSSSAASSSASSSSGSGGGPSGRILLYAGGADTLFGATFDGASWATQTVIGGTDRRPGLAIVDATLAMAVHRDSKTGLLTATKHDGKAWGTPVGIAPKVTTQSAPSAVLRGTAVDVTFHGDDFKHYFASFAGAWLPTAEAVKPGVLEQSYGPAAGAVAAVGQELVFAYPGGNGSLYEQSRTGGAWKAAVQHTGASTGLTPAIVSLTAGPELLVVFAGADKKLMFSTRTAGAWNAPSVVEANTFSGDPPAIAALPNGAAALVFRGLDGKPYASFYDPGAKPPWSGPKAVAAANPAVVSTPSLAAGVGGKTVELAYVAADGKAYHVRHENGAWGAPALVGGTGLVHVAIASAP